MAKTIYLLNFKNYNNREIEVPGDHAEDYTKQYGNINVINNMTLWNPNDGINTVITTCWFVNTIPNYVLVTPTDSDEIESRWWVIKHERIAGTQYRLYLYRDLIADNIDLVLNNSHSYILRGYCDSTSDLIYNTEDFSCNQIKSSQIPLYDKTGVPWFVIYIKSPGIKQKDTSERQWIYDYTNIDGIYSYTDPENGKDGKTSYFAFYIEGDRVNTGTPESPVWVEQPFQLHLPDLVPYYILTLPYAKCTFSTANGETTMSKERVALTMNSIQQLMGDWVLDFQIVPFAPMNFDTVKYKDDAFYFEYDTWYKRGLVPLYNESTLNNPFGFVLSSTTTSRYYFNLYAYTNPSSGTGPLYEYKYFIDDLKLAHNTISMRLTSPNGSSSFEFKPSSTIHKNGAAVVFTADMTLQPFNVYLNIKPSFSRLYGSRLRDYRGLNASGDYSLPQLSTAWISYVQNNKNYEVSFQRQVNMMEQENKIATINNIASAVTSTASAAAVGGIAGGAVGMAVGAVAGMAAGITDTITNSNLRELQLEETIKQHNLALQNIKAQPTTLSNLNTFNIDNLFVPILEIYKCSKIETTRFNNYIAENGYNISIIGKLSDYTKSGEKWYYKLILNRLDDFIGDSNMLESLIKECSNGFYYKYGG